MAGILKQNYDTSKIALFGNTSQDATLRNNTGGTVTYPAGRLLGRATGTQYLAGHVSTAADGSQQPIGVLIEEITLAAGAMSVVSFWDGGDMAEEKIILGGSDTMATTIVGGDVSIRDAIARATRIKLRASQELSGYDNA